MTRIAAGLLLMLLCGSQALGAQSRWAGFDSAGKLGYGHFQGGDRIPDFSSAGYRGGGVALPEVASRRTVAPSGGDDTAAIQQAIEDVSKLPLAGGSRGAVLLTTGTFHCSATIRIATSGVVLRGEGRTVAGTTIMMTGDPHLAIRVAGKLDQQMTGKPTSIADEYVPAGATSFHVKDAAGFHAGDTVLIVKPVTPAWLHYMGMDALGERKGKAEQWVKGELAVRRRIAAAAGNTITLEVPLMDSYDAKFLGAGTVTVTRVEVSGQIAETGVESLRVVAPPRKITLGEPEFDGLAMRDAADSWVKDVAFEETTNSVAIDSGTERVTVVDVSAVNREPILGAAKPFDFQTNGQQILFDRITGSGDRTFYFATQARQQGPVVVLDCRFTGDGHIQPHQRWSTGLLVDNCEVPQGGIDLMNRGMMGSGHGWAIGWSVIWNSRAESFVVQSPPGAANWSIGNTGEELNPPQPAFEGGKAVPLKQGIVESTGVPVKPRSLYLEQLSERLGPDALRNIGY